MSKDFIRDDLPKRIEELERKIAELKKALEKICWVNNLYRS